MGFPVHPLPTCRACGRSEFRLDLRNVHLLAEDDLHWLEEFEGQLSDAERLALVTARHNGLVDNASLRDLTGLQVAEVTKVLGGLRDKGLLRMRGAKPVRGAKRGAWYELGAEAPELPEDRHQLPIPGFTSGGETNSEGLEGSLQGLPSNSEGLGDSLQGLPPSSEGLTPDDLSIVLGQRAHRIATTSKVSPSLMKEVITELCLVKPLSLKELARFLNRHEVYLGGIPKQLVEEGAIQYEYPATPRHPRQRYIANPAGGSQA